MLTIGDFARLVGVSVRMLRHYDQLGLLVPARARRDELVAQIAADGQRIRQIEARLRTIEQESTMSTSTETPGTNVSYAVQPLPALRLAQLTATVTEQEEIGAVVGPLFERLFGALGGAGIAPTGPGVAWYEGDDDGISIGVGAPFAGEAVPEEVSSFTLPAVSSALVTTYVSDSIEGIGPAWQAIVREAEARGLSLGGGACREIYTATPMEPGITTWVVELQQPVA